MKYMESGEKNIMNKKLLKLPYLFCEAHYHDVTVLVLIIVID